MWYYNHGNANRYLGGKKKTKKKKVYRKKKVDRKKKVYRNKMKIEL